MKKGALRIAVAVLRPLLSNYLNDLLMKVAAPPGFEPGVEVLQSKNADRASHEIAELFSNQAIRVVPRWMEFGPFGSPR